ncbi:MAG TPA: hypothetical protein VFX55_19895 [Duganella sp.]|nr:hypothetical protein [Duganella sp.]
MMRVLLLGCSAAALLAAAPAPAQVTLGRLFATPAERAAMEASRGARAALLPNSQGVAPAPAPDPGMAGGAPMMDPNAAAAAQAAAVQAAPPPTLTMTGVLRSSDNRSVVFLNGEPQPGLKAGAQVLVTMPSGRKVLLKPGQRYDLNESRVKDVNEP